MSDDYYICPQCDERLPSTDLNSCSKCGYVFGNFIVPRRKVVEGEFKKRILAIYQKHHDDYDIAEGEMPPPIDKDELLPIVDEARKDFEELIQHFPDMHDYFEEEAKKVADNWRDNALKPIILKWFGEKSK